MDFEFTSQPTSRPIWANNGEDVNTPRKREYANWLRYLKMCGPRCYVVV